MNFNDIGSFWRWIRLLDFMNQTLFISYITVVHYWDLKKSPFTLLKVNNLKNLLSSGKVSWMLKVEPIIMIF